MRNTNIGQSAPATPIPPPRIASFLKAAMVGAILLAGCSMAPQQRYSDVAALVPPPAADRARIYFYRDDEPYESLARPQIFLNGSRFAVSGSGEVFYRDLPPGSYLVAVDSYGIYPRQDKTVAVRAGETYYIKIESLRSWASGGGVNVDYERDTFVVALIDTEQARQEISALDFFGSP